MKVTNNALSSWHQLQKILDKGSEAANVQRLMTDMEAEMRKMIAGPAAFNDAESFPHKIANSSSDRIKKLLDII